MEKILKRRRRPARICLLALALVTGPCLAGSDLSASARPSPQLFAPMIVSGGANDGAPSFAPDGRTLLFERTNGRWSAILESRLIHGTWSAPTLAPFSGTKGSDQQPAFSPDGRYVIFVSSRNSQAASGSRGTHVNHLFRVNRMAGGWSPAVELPAQVNISNRVFKPSVAANGDLYFMSSADSNPSPKWRLFVARWSGSGYVKAQPLAFSGPDDGDVDPFVAPDQSFLVFSSNTRSVLKDGHEHLFVVHARGMGWSGADALRYDGDDIGADDGEAQVDPARNWLYFTSSRTLPMSKKRDRTTAEQDLLRMQAWDNGNNNVWRLPMSAMLQQHGAASGRADTASAIAPER